MGRGVPEKQVELYDWEEGCLCNCVRMHFEYSTRDVKALGRETGTGHTAPEEVLTYLCLRTLRLV